MRLCRIAAFAIISALPQAMAAPGAVADEQPVIQPNVPQTGSQQSGVTLDMLAQKAAALSRDIEAIQANFSGAARAKLDELARVVAQLRENIATAMGSNNPDEVAFLSSEFESLSVQLVALKVTRSCNTATAFNQALIDTAMAGPGVAKGLPALLPLPVFGRSTTGTGTFELTDAVRIVTSWEDSELGGVVSYLNEKLKTPLSHVVAPATDVGAPCIRLELRELTSNGKTIGAEGYALKITPSGVSIRASTPQGIFYGVQTLLQLLPPQIYDRAGISTMPKSWTLPSVEIVDWPRFGYRGVMLDTARHFMSIDEIKRLIDHASLLKVNIFHWHLSDDQGWRIDIPEMPELTKVGGHSEVGSAPDPTVQWYYTQEEYKDVVAYAAERFVTIIPEIDGPGHTSAAKAAYIGLNCDNQPVTIKTDTGVGYPGLCLTDPNLANTKDFLNKLWTSLAAITPGPYMHVGGDEAPDAHGKMGVYADAVKVPLAATGKIAIGWHELADADNLEPGTVLQFWGTGNSATAIDNGLRQGAKVLMSPANLTYLDMCYGRGANDSPCYNWAGLISIEKSYSWDPGKYLRSGSQFVAEDKIVGLEAPLWSETAPQTKSGVSKNDWIDRRAFPRLASYAELGWSPVAGRSWAEYKVRLGHQGARWEALGVKYFPSDEQIPWQSLPRTIVLNQ